MSCYWAQLDIVSCCGLTRIDGFSGVPRGCLAAANFPHVPSDAVLHSLVGIGPVTPHKPPPARLMRDAQFAIDLLSTYSALPLQLLVLVGGREAPDDLDDDGQECRAVPAGVDGGVEALDIERTVLKVKGDESLEGGHDSDQREEDQEAPGREAEDADGAVDDAAVARAIVLDGVPEGEHGEPPANNETERPGFEATVGGSRHGLEFGLFGVALAFYATPVSGDNEEEALSHLLASTYTSRKVPKTYQPQPKVEAQRHQELDPSPPVALRQYEGVRVDELPFHPATPVSDSLPEQGHGA